MKVLMVGSGGREHALIRALKKSERVTDVICAPGNGGIACDAKCFSVDVMDIPGMLHLAKQEQVDLVFVASDDPLAAGMVDAMQEAGLRAFGPLANAAVIESSKVFSKNLMQKYHIPTAAYRVCANAEEAITYLKVQNSYPTVIKADGLALGKGVIIAEDYAQAEAGVQSIMQDKAFGNAGNRVVIEEYLQGPEVSVLAFADGKTLVPMVSSMDHKRAYDGNLGPNTGGMGTISPNPFYTAEIAKQCMEQIFLPTINAMRTEGRPFQGCLYFGLMLTKDGPKVIEYNARFGDPEAQVVLPRLKTPLIDIVDAVIDQKLDTIDIQWDDRACACVVLASGGYPKAYQKGLEICNLQPDGQHANAEIFHAGTKQTQGKFYTNGGRVLGISTMGDTLQQALDSAYQVASDIRFAGVHYRKDIGKTTLSYK